MAPRFPRSTAPTWRSISVAISCGRSAAVSQRSPTTRTVLDDRGRVATSPAAFLDDTEYAGLAQLLLDRAGAGGGFVPREVDAPYQIWGVWGDNLEAAAVQQLKNACKLPVAVSGALM